MGQPQTHDIEPKVTNSSEMYFRFVFAFVYNPWP